MRCSRTEAPSLRRRYPASPVLRASPPPCPARPDPHGLSVDAYVATARASRVASIPLFHACRRHYPGGAGRCWCRSLPDPWQPSPLIRRVGFRVIGFEACSAFTRVAARMVTEPPEATLAIGVLQTTSLPPSSAPTVTGWSDSCRAGFAPAEDWRLLAAHGEYQLRCCVCLFEIICDRVLRSHRGRVTWIPSPWVPSGVPEPAHEAALHPRP